MEISPEEIRRAHERIAPHIVETPAALSKTLSAQLGCELFIKFENLQFTSSFKERGALNCLLCHPQEVADGVIAMSAGNHAQALAYHGQRLGLPVTIVMPKFTPNAKVEATRVFGAEVILRGNQFDETKAFTEELATQRGLYLIHPYDNVDVATGQGTVAFELLKQVPDLDAVVVPVGGGGLIAGLGTAIKSARPAVSVIGVQTQRFRGAYDVFHGTTSAENHASSVAEGIAVKQPGAIATGLLATCVDDMLLVTEDALEQAIFDLLEVEKTVAEGAGAAPLAAIRAHAERFHGQRIAMVLSGGNIDMMIMSSVLQRGLVRSQRLVRLQVEIQDDPGALAQLTKLLGDLDSNIVDIQHQRTFGVSSVRATLVDLVLQLRGEEQHETVMQSLSDNGYDARLLD